MHCPIIQIYEIIGGKLNESSIFKYTLSKMLSVGRQQATKIVFRLWKGVSSASL